MLIILLYRGYANTERIYLKGRVLEDENIVITETDGRVRNLINSFKRFETDEIPDASVLVHCNGQSFACKTDREGYFVVDEAWAIPAQEPQKRWLETSLELLSPISDIGHKIRAQGEVSFPSKQADYGIITDVDDTILHTHVDSPLKLRMLYNTFLKNAHQRLAMEGMPALLQAFSHGVAGQQENPVFYLSHSPWNMYDVLDAFLELQAFPKGPILLRDFGISPVGEYRHHKITSITHILEMYPELPFILMGDSAEGDADIYLEIARIFPSRIKAIYIRQTRDTKNARRVKKLVESQTDATAVLVREAEEIKKHAMEQEWL